MEEHTCDDGTFYVDGVEVDSHVDCVNLKAIETDEGFVTMHIKTPISTNQTLYQSQRPQHRIEKTPPPNAHRGRGGSADVRGNSFFCSGCEELFLADTSQQEIITADHIQHPIWALQIPSDALWH